MSEHYTLNVKNNSKTNETFLIFQQEPDINTPDITTLAWLTKNAHPATQLQFSWDTEYNFVWSKSNNLRTGQITKISQSWPANLTTQNSIGFDYEGGAYTFADHGAGAYEGNLYINQSGRVQSNEASVGIGMSGRGTHLIESQPNMKIIMVPNPAYYLAAGNYEEGEVLDVANVTENALKIQFEGTTSMEVSYNSDNTWSIISD